MLMIKHSLQFLFWSIKFHAELKRMYNVQVYIGFMALNHAVGNQSQVYVQD